MDRLEPTVERRHTYEPSLKRASRGAVFGGTFTALAVLVLVTGVVVEFTRIITGVPWPGFAPWVSHSVSFSFGLLWLATAVALFGRQRNQGWAAAAWALSLTSTVILFMHPLVLRVGGSQLALLYLAAAAFEAFFLRKVFRREAVPAF